MAYIVLWKGGGRVVSVELTAENLRHVKSEFVMSLIQRDATGTEHWDVLGIRKEKKRVN